MTAAGNDAMSIRTWLERSRALPGAPGARCAAVTAPDWRKAALDLSAAGARLHALWTDLHRDGDGGVHAVYLAEDSLLLVSLALARDERSYPGIADIFPAAARMQRAATDLTGIRAHDSDARPWLRHAAWSSDYLPLDPNGARPPPAGELRADDYAFVRVNGDGVHEIPVGPVHAGIIEPGHFRFSVVGEKVLRLEERLGYVHKGIEQLFTRLPLRDGHRLAARVSGDSAVAFSWAYCQALEGLAACTVSPRAAWLRALALENERIANHLGDLGALGNDAGFAFALAQFSRLKELWLRATEAALGSRYLYDFVVPGGVARDCGAERLAELAACARAVGGEAAVIREILDEHAGVRDRFVGTGVVGPELATQLGLVGLAARASGRSCDLRADLPCEPYTRLMVRKAVRDDGDVAARVAVRFDELAESVRLVCAIAGELPPGGVRVDVAAPADGATAVGAIEGWRGPVVVGLTAGENGAIRRCHPHDPSWQNWPALEYAVIGNIVPDFPLVNKSFNLSYSGHDL
jgi:Ni,Fe-hydrogenase III large subunit/Ni,Fe-hydrogenase III component G